MRRLLRDRLSTWSTPGVALTYFSNRQFSVFSTSLAPRPGRERADDQHRRGQSGNVSTDIRGVTTAANTMKPMHAIATAIGLRSDSSVIWKPRPRPGVVVGKDVAALGDDHRARRHRLGIDVERTADLADDRGDDEVGAAAGDLEQRRLVAVHRRGGQRDRGRRDRRAVRERDLRGRPHRDRVDRAVGVLDAALDVDLDVRGAGGSLGRGCAPRNRPGDVLANRQQVDCDAGARRDRVEVLFGDVDGDPHDVAVDERRNRTPRRRERAGVEEPLGDLAVERRPQHAVVDLELVARQLGLERGDLRLLARGVGLLDVDLVLRHVLVLEQLREPRRLGRGSRAHRVDRARLGGDLLVERRRVAAVEGREHVAALGDRARPDQHGVDQRADQLWPIRASSHGSAVPT